MLHVAIAVALGIQGDIGRHLPVLVHDAVDDELQGVQGLPPLSDDEPRSVTDDLEGLIGEQADIGRQTHAPENLGRGLPGLVEDLLAGGGDTGEVIDGVDRKKKKHKKQDTKHIEERLSQGRFHWPYYTTVFFLADNRKKRGL